MTPSDPCSSQLQAAKSSNLNLYPNLYTPFKLTQTLGIVVEASSAHVAQFARVVDEAVALAGVVTGDG